MADARELFLGEGTGGGEGTKHLHVNMGPAHPAMHGIVRIFAELDGETVVKTDVEIGYLHRAFEKDCVNLVMLKDKTFHSSFGPRKESSSDFLSSRSNWSG